MQMIHVQFVLHLVIRRPRPWSGQNERKQHRNLNEKLDKGLDYIILLSQLDMPRCRYSHTWLPASSSLRGEGRVLESSLEVLLASSLRTKRKPQPNCPADILGSLSNNDGKGYENVTQKVKSRCFKLYRFYSISFNLSNVGNLFWS